MAELLHRIQRKSDGESMKANERDWRFVLIHIALWTSLVLFMAHGFYVQQRNHVRAEEMADREANRTLSASGKKDKIIIVLDAGHGGKDTGTSPDGTSVTEAEVNLRILKYLVTYFEEAGGAAKPNSTEEPDGTGQPEVQIICTRTEDTAMGRAERVELANQSGADLFVSIHCNSGDGGSGTEVIYMPDSGAKDASGSRLTSEQLAAFLLDSVSREAGFKSRGLISGEEIEIIRKAQMPAALVEVGFLNGGSDQDIILSKKGQKKVAKGIYQGILKALEEMEHE